VIKYTPLPAENISTSAEHMVALANARNEIIIATFNGIEIVAKHGDDVRVVTDYFDQQLSFLKLDDASKKASTAKWERQVEVMEQKQSEFNALRAWWEYQLGMNDNTDASK